MKEKKLFFGGLLVVFMIMLPIVISPDFNFRYKISIDRLSEMDKCLQDGQIPCRFVPDTGGTYGIPLFNYLAPLPFYIGEGFYLVSQSLILSTKLVFTLAFLGAYVFMALGSQRRLGKVGGVVGGVFYSLFVYFLGQTIENMWFLMLAPAVFWALWCLKEKVWVTNLLNLSVLLALLILSHEWGLKIFLPIFSIFVLMIFFQKKDRRFLKFAGAAVVIGLLLSAFYWLPMLTEQNLIYVPQGLKWESWKGHSTAPFLPIFAQEPPIDLPAGRYQIITGESEVVSYKEGTNWFSFQTNTKTHTILRLSKYYFPDWKILIDNKETVVEYKNNNLGLMTLLLGPGTHQIQGKLVDTPIRKIANGVTILGVLIWLLLIPTQIPKTRRWLFYYLKSLNR